MVGKKVRLAKAGWGLLAVCLMGMTGCAYFTVRDGELYVSTQMDQWESGRMFLSLPEPKLSMPVDLALRLLAAVRKKESGTFIFTKCG